jgi:hypothetical protein
MRIVEDETRPPQRATVCRLVLNVAGRRPCKTAVKSDATTARPTAGRAHPFALRDPSKPARRMELRRRQLVRQTLLDYAATVTVTVLDCTP